MSHEEDVSEDVSGWVNKDVCKGDDKFVKVT